MKKYNVNVKQAAKELGISVNTIYARIKSGWDIDDALSVGYIPQKDRVYDHHKKKKLAPVKIEPVKINVISCDKLTASVQRLNAAIDKILTLKSVKPKVVLKDAGTDLRKLSEHFVNMTDDDKHRYNNACGGVKINILNHVNADKKEFKYNVIGTNGKCLKTNDKSEFINFLRDEVY
jgi:hypothetical protein